jgi:pimeloyl-ACP methyl ester carboxylesterase
MIMKRTSNEGASVFAPWRQAVGSFCSAGIARRRFLRLSGASAVQGLASAGVQPAANAIDRPTFVMIHGSWHGAWVYEFVANLLTSNGFRVFAQDLPGFGLSAQFPSSYLAGDLDPDEVSPLAGITLDDYTESVVQLILSLRGRGPVIVMGHSLAGIVVNEVGERLGPEVIKHLVYLTAFMTPAGKIANDITRLTIETGSLVGSLLVGSSSVSGVRRLNPNSTDPAYRAQTQATFYGDIPAEQIPAILNLLTPDNPLLPLTVPTSITKDRWGKIPRTFIRCALDRSVPLGAQNALIAAADAFTPGNPTRTLTLQSSHSPFLSMPKQLASVLAQIAESTV